MFWHLATKSLLAGCKDGERLEHALFFLLGPVLRHGLPPVRVSALPCFPVVQVLVPKGGRSYPRAVDLSIDP